MKQKLSISLDEEKIKMIETILKEGFFRSRSHVLEYSLNKFLKEEKGLSQNSIVNNLKDIEQNGN